MLLYRVVFAVFVAGWVGLMFRADTTPVNDTLLGATTGAAATAALLVVVWPTVAGVVGYLAVAAIAVTVRTVGFIIENSWNPLFVWVMMLGAWGLVWRSARKDLAS
ncbi:MAG: hypothetical protein AAGG08_10755 [Actinomycetota bacterium]